MNRTARVVDPGNRSESESWVFVINDDLPASQNSSKWSFWKIKEKPYRVANPAELNLTKGDTVALYLPPGRTVFWSAVTFLLPLFMFPLGYTFSKPWFSFLLSKTDELPIIHDNFSFLVGFMFLLLSMPLIFFVRSLIENFLNGEKWDVPEIIAIVPSSELQCGGEKSTCCGSCGTCK